MRWRAGLLVVAAGLLLAATPAAAAAEAPVTPRAHVIQIAVPRDAAQPFLTTDEDLQGLVRSAAAYWEQQSAGQITSFTVNPDIDVVDPQYYGDPCDSASLFESAPRAYPSGRFPTGPSPAPEHLVLLVPDSCAGHGGIATLGQARFASGGVVAITTVGRPAKVLLTLIHELGHNFGLSHSYGAVCGGLPAEELTGDCREQPYFGFAEIMSTEGAWPSIADHSPPVLGAVFRAYLGLETVGEAASVDWAGHPERSTFTYELRPRGEDTGLRSVWVTDPYTARRYVLEYRSGTGRDAGAFYASGETITDTTPDGRPLPVTMTPGVAIQEAAAPSLDLPDGSDRPVWIYDRAASTGNFGPGREWFTPNRGLRVRVGAIDPGASATVEVTVYPRRVTAKAPPAVVGVAQVGQTLRADLAGWRPTPDRCHYQWLADGAEVGGETGVDLVIGPDLIGARLRVRADCVVDGAAPVEPLTSEPTAPVEPAPTSPPDPQGQVPPPVDAAPVIAPPAASPASPPASVSARRLDARLRLQVARPTASLRDRVRIRIRVRPAVGGPPISGFLTVAVDGRPVRRLVASDAVRTLALPRLPPGRHHVVVRYAGSAAYAATRSPVSVLTIRGGGSA